MVYYLKGTTLKPLGKVNVWKCVCRPSSYRLCSSGSFSYQKLSSDLPHPSVVPLKRPRHFYKICIGRIPNRRPASDCQSAYTLYQVPYASRLRHVDSNLCGQLASSLQAAPGGPIDSPAACHAEIPSSNDLVTFITSLRRHKAESRISGCSGDRLCVEHLCPSARMMHAISLHNLGASSV